MDTGMIRRYLLMFKGIIVVCVLLVGTIACGDESVKQTGKRIEQGVKSIGRDAGKAFEKRKELGKGLKEIPNEIGNEPKKTGFSAGELCRDYFRKAGEAFKRLGRDIKGVFAKKVRQTKLIPSPLAGEGMSKE
jgi:hypothetical protein